MSSPVTTKVETKRSAFGYHADTMTPIHWVTFSLAAITGAIHLYLWSTQGNPAFLFAGAVFYGAVIAGLLNVYRRVLFAIGIPFTAGQIAIWYLMGMPDMSIAIIDKPVQLVLIALLAYLFVNEDRLVEAKHESIRR